MRNTITAITPQLRTTDLASSIDFYTRILGFQLEFRYDDYLRRKLTELGQAAARIGGR